MMTNRRGWLVLVLLSVIAAAGAYGCAGDAEIERDDNRWMVERDEYRESMEERLEDINDRIKEMRAQTDGLGEQADQEYRESLNELEQQRDEVQRMMNDLGNAGESAWRDIRTNLDQGMQELERGYRDLTTTEG